MPIYEYQCEKCHHHLEALQKISDKPLRECPECGRHTLKRLVSAPMFRLAGSGWYETDFKSDKETKRNLAGKDEAPASESKESPGDSAAAKPDKAEKTDKVDKVDAPARKTLVTKPAPVRATSTKPRAVVAKRPAAKKTAKKR